MPSYVRRFVLVALTALSFLNVVLHFSLIHLIAFFYLLYLAIDIW